MSLAGNTTSTAGLKPEMKAGAKFLLQAAVALGASSARITSGKRSHAQQASLYKNFLAGKALYPVAPPGSSKHELGLAVDIVVTPASFQTALGQWWRSVGGTWGGSFNDPIHFEL